MSLSGFIKTASLLVQDHNMQKNAFFERFTGLNRQLNRYGKKVLGMETPHEMGAALAEGKLDPQVLASLFASKGVKKGEMLSQDLVNLQGLRNKLEMQAQKGGTEYTNLATNYQEALANLTKNYNLDKRYLRSFDDSSRSYMENLKNKAAAVPVPKPPITMVPTNKTSEALIGGPKIPNTQIIPPDMNLKQHAEPQPITTATKPSWWSKLQPETRSKIKWGLGGAAAIGTPIGAYNMLKTPEQKQPYGY